MKIHTLHNGCEVNLADSESSKASLLRQDEIQYSSKEQADLIIFHSCTFTQHKEEETINTIKDLLANTTKKIIVSGCFLKEYIKSDRIQYIKNERLPELFQNSSNENEAKRSLDKNPISTLLPFVTISRGCYGNCTFCSIKSAQGSNKSRDIQDILIDVEARLDLQYVKLVGDEVAGYGRDMATDLKALIDAIVTKFPSIKIKLGSLNCKLLKKYSDNELEIFAHPNIIGNIHIPIQSASNKVLQLMSRGYTIEEYQIIYNKLKKLGVNNISTDIICGFPEESEEDHRSNISFICSNRYEFLEVFAYQEREGTTAAAFAQIPYEIRKQRAIQLIVNFIKSYGQWHSISYKEIVKNQKIFNTNIKFN